MRNKADQMARGVIFLLMVLVCSEIHMAMAAVRSDLRGQAALSLIANDIEPRSLHTALRYVPELTTAASLGGTRRFTALLSLDATWQSRIVSFENATSDSELEVYRLWLRYTASRLEARLGRQKLSFGAATILRPLMWFDSVDPRDPLQITDGVDAALVRYYLLNNANFWLWGIYGSDEPKGWELVPTAKETAEYGGRLQWPAGNGEVAFSYHHRQADLSALAPPTAIPVTDPHAPEDRYALDGKWDVIVGLWFEAVLIQQRNDLLVRPYRRLASVGIDYTFELGQGLTALAEHLILGASEEPFGKAENSDYSAFLLRYLWGVVDEFSLILYRDWDADELFSFLEWRRTYDRWSFHLMAFANPTEGRPSPLMPESDLLAGRGLRALIVFNH